MISYKERWILISAQSFSAAGQILQLWFNSYNPALDRNHAGHFRSGLARHDRYSMHRPLHQHHAQP